jgi:hypothetical protein
MHDEGRLDAHLERALDELLSLASAASAGGRPELALAASAALDELLAFLAGAAAPRRFDRTTALAGDRPHAQH